MFHRKLFKASSSVSSKRLTEIYEQAVANAAAFDDHFHYKHKALTIAPCVKQLLPPIQPPPTQRLTNNSPSERKKIPQDPVTKQYIVPLPPYALSGRVPSVPSTMHSNLDEERVMEEDSDHPLDGNEFESQKDMIRNARTIKALRQAGQLARSILEYSCSLAIPGRSTDEINDLVHDAILLSGAYPSPLNYAGFPKSVCTSVNEVVCHGIPHSSHILKPGDIVKFDVSCFYNGVHGDNCATVIIDDSISTETNTFFPTSTIQKNHTTMVPHFLHKDWRDVPYKQNFRSMDEELLFITARRLSMATYEALMASISTCHPGSCLTTIGNVISMVADAYGYDSVRKYRGHGIGTDFHIPPFVKHYRNQDRLELRPGMVFTIEPMFTEGSSDCEEWESDGWTVVTKDRGRSAQFEHMICITDEGRDILTLQEGT